MTDTPSPDRRRIALFFLVTALLAVAGMRYEYGRKPWMEPVRGDGRGYYAYLPNYLLHGDPSLEAVARSHYEGAYPDSTGVRRYPETGRWLDQYNLGEALLMLPFFAAGHLVAKTRGLPLDGYSSPYQWGAALSGTFYFLLGMFAVWRMLARRHGGPVTLATLVALAFGSNLFHHGTRDSIYSHAYTFCLIALLCVATEAWYAAATWRTTIALGLTVGLIALVRLPNGVAALIPALWGLQSPRELPARAKFLLVRWRSLAASIVIAFIVFAPQLAVWKYATGHWLVNTYAIYATPGRKAWDFLHPKVFSLLFSVKKGLFFWSPMLLIASAGFVALRRARSEYFWPALLTLSAQTWIMGAWVFWDYGGSYGHRGYTDWLALFAPPLAMTIERARRSRFADLFWCALWATVFLSVYQMLQYWHEMIPSEGPTWEQYQKLFLNF